MNLEPTEVPALALRHDVDTCIWQPYPILPITESWTIKHQGTLSAFGYIQSSKQNRKFVTCSPNFGYGVVCEASRHIFIYKNCDNGNENCQLKKRNPGGVTKNVKVGQQHVINIDKFGEILGISATNRYLFLLTDKTFVAIEVM